MKLKLEERAVEEFNRITRNPAVMGGKACVRAEFPYLEREDITRALRYAAWLASEREVLLASA